MNTPTSNSISSLHAALDVGTTSIKCILLDSRSPSDVRVIASTPTPILRPAPGVVEVDVLAVLDAAADQLRSLFAFAADVDRPIASIGPTGFVGSAICLDRHHNPIGPIAIWQDQRCSPQSLDHFSLPPDQIRAIHGIDLPRGVCWPGPKIRWLHDNHPQVLAAAVLVLQIKDYLFLKLTGLSYSEARTNIGLANIVESRFDPAVLAWARIRPDQLPELHAAHESFPMLDAWRELFPAYNHPLPLVGVGTADMTAAFLACQLEPGQAALLANTSEIVGLAIPHHSPDPTPKGVIRVPYQHSLDLIYGSTTNGGSSLDWFQSVFGPLDHVALAALITEAQSIAPSPRNPLFLPYLMGERAPIWNEHATGAFFNLRASHTRAHLLRAVLEGCAFSKKHILETARPNGAPLTALIACGGTSRIPLWNQIRASVLNVPVHIDACPESSALGALFLAAQSTCPELPQRYLSTRTRSVEQPVPQWVQPYQFAYSRYLELSSAARHFWSP